MKWIVGIPAFLLAGLIAAGVFGPRLVDWNVYKPEIEARIDALTGLQTRIDGNIGLALLPTPRVTVAATQIRNRDAAIGTIRWMEARLKLSDLLRGDIRPVDLTLIEPLLSIDADGSAEVMSGLLPDSGPDETGGESTGTAAPGGRTPLTVTVRGGSIEIRMQDTVWRADGIDGVIESPTIGRRLTIDATVPTPGGTLELQGRFAPPAAGDPGPVSFALRSGDGAFRSRFGGVWTLRDGRLHADGKSSIEVSDGEALNLLVPGAGAIGAGLTDTLRIESAVAFDGTSRRIAFSDLTLGAAHLSASGSAVFAFQDRPRVELALGFSRLDADALIPGDNGAAPAARAQAQAGAEPGAASAEPMARPELAFPAISGLPFDLAVELSALGTRFRGTLVQRLTLRASLEQGAVTVEELSARLPGSTELSVAGFGDLTDPNAAIEGNASVRSDDLRRLLEWSGLPVPDVSPERLRSFSLVSGISLGPDRLDIVDAALLLDDVRARAAAAVALRGRVGVGLRLEIDQLNLDSLLRHAAETDAGDRAPPGAAVSAAPANGETGTKNYDASPFWSSFDASTELRIGRLTAAGIPFTDLSAKLDLTQGLLSLGTTTLADAGGVRGRGEGHFMLAAGAPVGTFEFRGESEDFGRFLAVLDSPDWAAGVLRSMGPGRVSLSFVSSEEERSASIDVEARDGGISAMVVPGHGGYWQGGVIVERGSLTAPDWELTGFSGTIRNDGTAVLLEDGRGRLNGGAFDIDAAFGPGSGGLNELSVTGAIRDVAVARALGDLDGRLGIVGDVSLSGNFQARGSDWRALESTNSGTIALSGTLAAQVGPSRTTIVTVKRVTEVRQALNRHFSAPGRLSGQVQVRNGTLVADGLTWAGSEGAGIDLTGVLDVKRGTVAAEAVLTAPSTDGGSRLSIDGNVTAPNLRLSGKTGGG